MDEQSRISKALEIAGSYGTVDGDHHKAWVIDQMVRALSDCPIETIEAVDCRGNVYSYKAFGESDEYLAFVEAVERGEDGPQTYSWPEGIAP